MLCNSAKRIYDSIELIKIFLESERNLYLDIEMIMHVICIAAASMSVESVIESMVSIYENRNNKFRPISEERAVLEMNIAINGPELAHADGIIQASMAEYWKNSGKQKSETRLAFCSQVAKHKRFFFLESH
jgi:hypothetical protein